MDLEMLAIQILVGLIHHRLEPKTTGSSSNKSSRVLKPYLDSSNNSRPNIRVRYCL